GCILGSRGGVVTLTRPATQGGHQQCRSEETKANARAGVHSATVPRPVAPAARRRASRDGEHVVCRCADPRVMRTWVREHIPQRGIALRTTPRDWGSRVFDAKRSLLRGRRGTVSRDPGGAVPWHGAIRARSFANSCVPF